MRLPALTDGSATGGTAKEGPVIDGPGIEGAGVLLSGLAPVVDGVRWAGAPEVVDDGAATVLRWLRAGEVATLRLTPRDDRLEVTLTLSGLAPGRQVDALGIRFAVAGARRYLRHGFTSWDGSYFVEPEAARAVVGRDPRIAEGHAMTALVAADGGGVLVAGFERHDRFQSRFAFDFAAGPLCFTAETLLDRVRHDGGLAAERLVIFAHDCAHDGALEGALRDWARIVAGASPLPPRLPGRRIAGWCSWYGLYASIDDALIRQAAAALAGFRAGGAGFATCLIDDGFTPEMGDWLEVRPTFPQGMKPVLDDIAARGLVPGLWIAPFLVGNRSHLFADHPDWVVRDAATGRPLAPMTFYGEFRWHKRSEEYHVLDITHPGAEAYIREVFRTWAQDWGCRFFKTDFMHVGALYGPDRARWHIPGQSRMAVWMRMARLIREEIGEAAHWLICGAPIWAPVGLIDAARIGRDVGVVWDGHQSAQSLLRDQCNRNFANGILWQADPDCVLLRDRFHDLSEDQVTSLAIFAGLAGGLWMTGDALDDLRPDRAEMFRRLLDDGVPRPCDFPALGASPLRYRVTQDHQGMAAARASGDAVIVQRAPRADGSVWVNLFNTGDLPTMYRAAFADLGLAPGQRGRVVLGTGAGVRWTEAGVAVPLGAHASVVLRFARG